MSAGTTAPPNSTWPRPMSGSARCASGRQVAGRADAPLLRHDRVDAAPEELQQAVDQQRPATAVAERERVGAEQEHRADDLAREGRPDARRVAHQEVLLEPPGVGRLDDRRGEGAEPGRDAVHDGALGDERFDEVARLLHPLARVAVERDASAPPRATASTSATVRSAPVRTIGAPGRA